MFIESMRDYAVYPDSFDFIINDEVGESRAIGKHFETCYRQVETEWMLFGNDDVVMQTGGWDLLLLARIAYHKDQIALYWPDDTIFSQHLACFPIVSKKAMSLIDEIWPMPFEMYKVDDSIMDVFPTFRRYYLPEIVLKHNNDKGTEGFHLPDGRCYPNDPVVLARDTQRYQDLQGLRNELRIRLVEAMA